VSAADSSKRPLVGVGVVVLKGEPGAERVLLVKRGKAPRLGSWSLPGGRPRPG
jgi:8-oxo-dGTP diphosphatase